MTDGRPAAPDAGPSPSCSPTSRARRSSSRRSAPSATARSSSATGRSCARPWQANGGDRAGHRGRLVLRRRSPSAATAVAAAVAGQRALAAEPWPDDAEVRVRMGLHTGEAELGRGGSATSASTSTGRRGSRRRPRRPDPRLRRDERAARRRTCRAGVTLRDLGELPAQGPAGAGAPDPGRSSTACRPSSRRCGRSTPGRTTCRPS